MELVGRNEGIAFIKNSVGQRSSEGMQFPNDTNSRGASKLHREHHADGDVVGKADGDMVKKADGDLVKKAMGGPMGPEPVVVRPTK
jgi:hypothetical protein